MAADCRIDKEERLPSSAGTRMAEYDKAEGSLNSFSTNRTRNLRNDGTSKFKLAISRTFVCLVLLLLLENVYPVCSLVLDCDSVQSCICGKEDDGGWRIECPNSYQFQYPIELKGESCFYINCLVWGFYLERKKINSDLSAFFLLNFGSLSWHQSIMLGACV